MCILESPDLNAMNCKVYNICIRRDIPVPMVKYTKR